jgi:hypothetical protein
MSQGSSRQTPPDPPLEEGGGGGFRGAAAGRDGPGGHRVEGRRIDAAWRQYRTVTVPERIRA